MKDNEKQMKLHYKMYKSGKSWLIASIVTFTTGASVILSNYTVNADTNSINQSSVTNPSDSTTNNNVISVSSAAESSTTASSALQNSISSAFSYTASSATQPSSNNSVASLVVSSQNTKLNNYGVSITSKASKSSSDISTAEGLMTNTVLNQNFHYNVPRGYSNDIQTILPHENANGKVDYYDVYYLYNPDPNQINFADEWYHVRTTDFKTFTPLDSANPTSVNNVAIPDPDFKDKSGNSTQVASNNTDGIPWGYVASGSLIYNDGMLTKDEWNNPIDKDAKLAYFTDLNPNVQTIFLAYSNNDQQFHPYSSTPIISGEELGISKRPDEFRDISVNRVANNKLVAYVASGYTSKIYVLTSDDGVNWAYDSQNDITLGRDGLDEIETPVVRTINGQAFMFYSWHNDQVRGNAVINGFIDNNGIFRTNSASKSTSVDGVAYKGDTYAGNYTNISEDALVNINWNGNWSYSPLGVGNGYNYFSMHSGSFALPKLVKNVNGQLQYTPIEPNNEFINTYKTDSSSWDTPILINPNNKLDFSFDYPNTTKVIKLSRNESTITITIKNGTITIDRNSIINNRLNKVITAPFGLNNVSKLSMYMDNASIELYLPETNQTYNIVNLSTLQNEPYSMNVNTSATIDNYEFNNSYPALSASQIEGVINNLKNNINNDTKVVNSLAANVNKGLQDSANDASYASVSSLISNTSSSLSAALTSISTVDSYLATASSASGDARSSLYLTLASSAYASASNAENDSTRSIMYAKNVLSDKASKGVSDLNGKKVINGHNILIIDGKQVYGQIITDGDGQSHYYDAANGYEATNTFYSNNGKYYYFDNNGNMTKDKFISAIPNTDYNYYFGSDGVAVNGNQTINGKKYLFINRIQAKDTLVINSNDTFSYYNKNGLLATSSAKVNGKLFNFDRNGNLKSPNTFIKYSTNNYYLDANSKIYKGFAYINGHNYFFDNNGVMMINGIVRDDVTGILYKSNGFGVLSFSSDESNNTGAGNNVGNTVFPPGINNTPKKNDDTKGQSVNNVSKAKTNFDKAKTAFANAKNNLKNSHSKAHVYNYQKARNNYLRAEQSYLKISGLYDQKYYYNFDQLNNQINYIKTNKSTYVHSSKKFTKQNRIYMAKMGSIIKVKEIVRDGKTTRFSIGNNKFITGLKSFVNKASK